MEVTGTLIGNALRLIDSVDFAEDVVILLGFVQKLMFRKAILLRIIIKTEK